MGIKWPRDDRNGNYTAADLQKILVTAPDFLEPRGLLLADVMGLGKTLCGNQSFEVAYLSG